MKGDLNTWDNLGLERRSPWGPYKRMTPWPGELAHLQNPVLRCCHLARHILGHGMPSPARATVVTRASEKARLARVSEWSGGHQGCGHTMWWGGCDAGLDCTEASLHPKANGSEQSRQARFLCTRQSPGASSSPEGGWVTQQGKWLDVRRMEGYRSPAFRTKPLWGGLNSHRKLPLGSQDFDWPGGDWLSERGVWKPYNVHFAHWSVTWAGLRSGSSPLLHSA